MKRPKQPSPEHLAWLCDAWNKLYPVGTLMEYHPVIGEAAFRLRCTRTAAFVLSGHTAAVFLEDEPGCVSLDACKPVKAGTP